MILLIILAVNTLCIATMLYVWSGKPTATLSALQKIKLGISGFLAFVADTLGIGSFIAFPLLSRMFNTFNEQEWLDANRLAQILPGLLEALLFMQLADIEHTTFVTLIVGVCLGSILSTLVVSRLSERLFRVIRLAGFMVLMGILLCHQFHFIPYGAEITVLNDYRLLSAFFAMFLCGALTSVGIGLFVMVQSVLFLFHITPIAAFPIMMSAGAIQQPISNLLTLNVSVRTIPFQTIAILSASGCIGVLVTFPLFHSVTVSWLQTMLLGLLLYNALATGLSLFPSHRTKRRFGLIRHMAWTAK